ncbi:MAG: methylated-DNA--[protein]-cysteine S-methyltransferase [Streptosporangiales bacterium]|nr:methylated-DNA--[protein]-cysteine S-methyltransferase [Streptosporangiales bacterium]
MSRPAAVAEAVFASPVGKIAVQVDESGVRVIDFLGKESPAPVDERPAHPVLREVGEQLRTYFAGERTTFDLPLAFRGSPFQLRVWQALLEVPYGYTWTYKELAERVDGSANPRSVGSANGQNPLPIVVPCHRVVGADGTLVGYGGGLDIKRKLLELEARVRIATEFAP